MWAPAGVEPEPWPTGFRVRRRRSKVERSVAWLGRQRRLGTACDVLPSTGEAWIDLTMIRLLAARPAGA